MCYRSIFRKSAWAILALVLTACLASSPQNIHLPIPLGVNRSGYSAIEVSTVVGKDGTKYFAWTECPVPGPGNCLIYVSWTKMGAPGPLVVLPADQNTEFEDNQHPDIAVTDAGKVFLVWVQKAIVGTTSTTRDCWMTFDPANPGIPSCTVLNTTEYNHYGLPRIAARGSYVYAVYGVIISGGTPRQALRYKQLAGGTKEGWVNKGGDGLLIGRNHNPSPAVSSTGRLFIAWVELTTDEYGDPVTYYRFGCTNATGTVIYPGPEITEGADASSTPAIAVSMDNTKVATAFVTSANIMSVIYTGCTTTSDGVIGSDLTGFYLIEGDPSLVFPVADTNEIWIAFAGRKGTTPGPAEIFMKGFTTGATQISNNSWDDLTPVIGLVYEDEPGYTGYSNVIAWRTEVTNGTATWFDSVYVYFGGGVMVKAFGGVSSGGAFDFATNNLISTGGIWVSHPKTTSSREVPYISFNDYALHAPVIQK